MRTPKQNFMAYLPQQFHVIWHDTDKRECFVTDCSNTLKMKKNEIKPILVKSYFTKKEMIKGDIKQWRRFNK